MAKLQLIQISYLLYISMVRSENDGTCVWAPTTCQAYNHWECQNHQEKHNVPWYIIAEDAVKKSTQWNKKFDEGCDSDDNIMYDC